jgi:hypothetical protein
MAKEKAMMTIEFITDKFVRDEVGSHRWRFEPKPWEADAPKHRYFLTFLREERRFILSRQQIAPVQSVADEEQLAVFRGLLTADEVAECMRVALTAPPPDDIPF